MNDLSSVVKCQVLLYADDTALIVSGKNVLEIEEALSEKMERVSLWLAENKLSLHIGKTESIVFASKRKLKNRDTIRVKCAGDTLDSKSRVKYLGVELDQSLTGEHIADKIIKNSQYEIKVPV